MRRINRLSGINRLVSLILLGLLVPAVSMALVEEKTGKEYPDNVMIGEGADQITLQATGAALREKTILKVDVYTIASYVAADVDLGEDPADSIREIKAPKQLRMDLRRSFSREKLINAFREVIEKNFDDMEPIAADLAVFEGYFTRDAEDGDVIIFTFLPGVGLTTNLNGEDTGTITNPLFAEALWTVWFGEKPANGGMKKNLVAMVKSSD